MNYRVEYKNQNWLASQIEASSPFEAAKLLLERDVDKRYNDYPEVTVSWGLFGKHAESFKVAELLPHLSGPTANTHQLTRIFLESASASTESKPQRHRTMLDSVAIFTFFILFASLVAFIIGYFYSGYTRHMIWFFSGFFAFYSLFGLIYSMFTGKTGGGASTTAYYCPHCKELISVGYIPAQSGILFPCPHCGTSVRS